MHIQIQRPDLRGLRLVKNSFEAFEIAYSNTKTRFKGIKTKFEYNFAQLRSVFIQIQRPDLRGLRLVSNKFCLRFTTIQIQRPDLRGLRQDSFVCIVYTLI